MSQYAPVPWLPFAVTHNDSETIVEVPGPQRACGACLLCCKVLPVRDIEKPANKWCRHAQIGAGCKIYANLPTSCRVWSCLWVLDKTMPEELQPSRSHVIFDHMTDVVAAVDEQGRMERRRVIQLWVDPSHPAAHRAPAVRNVISKIGESFAMPTLARIGDSKGVLIAPPSMTPDGQWFEKVSVLGNPYSPQVPAA